MDVIIIFLMAIILYFSFKNVVLIRELFISRKYKKIYKDFINGDSNIITKLNDYINVEKNDYLISKAYVLLMYASLMNDIDVKDIIDKVDFEKIFLRNGKYDKAFVNINSDIIIWILCCMPRLNKVDYLSIVKKKMDKLKDILDNHIEYKVFCAVYSLLSRDREKSIFLDELVNGEYSGLDYDKQLIGVTKRIALAYIASKNKEKNIEYADELKILSETRLGRNLLTDLEIYEVYK